MKSGTVSRSGNLRPVLRDGAHRGDASAPEPQRVPVEDGLADQHVTGLAVLGIVDRRGANLPARRSGFSVPSSERASRAASAAPCRRCCQSRMSGAKSSFGIDRHSYRPVPGDDDVAQRPAYPSGQGRHGNLRAVEGAPEFLRWRRHWLPRQQQGADCAAEKSRDASRQFRLST